ncbi:AEC family transporter [Aurantiacibacter flavus]|uniref:AEC family transporter n=1 Tax=Aurantiacibacter flavus TaxID=3145232 RepID=A0ABV0D3R7_9SPHN
MLFLDIFLVILPVFLVIGAGAAAASFGPFTNDFIEGLMAFAQSIAIPCLLFTTMARIDLSQSFDTGLIVSFYLAAGVCFLLGIFSSRALFNHQPGRSVALGFSSMYTNALLLGLPITAVAFGRDATTSNFAIIAFQAPVCYLIGVSAMEAANSGGRGLLRTATTTVFRILRQPHIFSLLAGLGLNLISVSLPDYLAKPLNMLGDAALPVALFALGGVLTRYSLRGSWRETGMVVIIALVINPALTLIFGRWFGLTQAALNSAVLTAAMAPGMNTYMFANIYRTARDVTANALLVGTAISAITTPLWIIILTV